MKAAPMDHASYEQIQEAAACLERNLGSAPKLAVVLGSGLAHFAKELQEPRQLKHRDIPGAGIASVPGHRAETFVGFIESKRVAVQAGRLHGFEGHPPARVVYLLRAMKLWGVEKFILTNATGSTHAGMPPGSLVLIKDHMNFTGQNPLVGHELYGGPRFPDMSNVYSKEWRAKAQKAAGSIQMNLREATYIGVLGPSFETASEIQAFHRWGADIVGMSTVWEAIALAQMGAELLGISCVCNFGTGVTQGQLSHEEVLEAGLKVEGEFRRLLRQIIMETAD